MRLMLIGGRALARAVYDALHMQDGNEVWAVWTHDQKLTDMADEGGSVWLWSEDPPEVEDVAEEVRPDLILSVHNHEIIPEGLIEAAPQGAIGYHPSLLPRHRGIDAVRWTIAMGDPIAGGTVYSLDDGIDTGPIILQDWCHVAPDWDASDLWRERLFPMGVDLLVKAVNGPWPAADPQDERFATYEPPWSDETAHMIDLDRMRNGETIREYFDMRKGAG